MQKPSKTWVSTGKQIEDFKRKKKNGNKIHDKSKNTPWNTRARNTRESGIYSASYNIIPLGPKMLLKTQIF